MAAPASTAGELVDVTLQIPASVYPNPGNPPDVVTVRGTLHIVYYVRADRQGGYHVNQLVDEKGTGTSALPGLRTWARTCTTTASTPVPRFPRRTR